MTRKSLIGRAIVAAGLAALFVPLSAPSGAAGTGGAAGGKGSGFTRPVKLTGASGGEPSIANDRHGNVYVVGPQGIPAGVNDEPGVAVWVSHNNGTSFPKAAHAGSFLGGGDSDVEVDRKTVYLADLEAAASAVCKSTDHGKTFTSIGPAPDPGKCGGVVVGQTGPSDDRQWLTADHHGHLYITYHEFVSAQPLILGSDDGGDDLFTAGPCGPIVTDPTIESEVPTDITGGTLVSKPVTDSAGNLYVMFTTTTQAQNAAAVAAGKPSGTFSQIYLAVSKDHCGSFKDYTVFDGSKLGTNTVQFGNIFNALTIDGGDNLYALGAGYIGKKSFATTSNVYLFSSHDHGKKWTSPTLVGSPKSAHSLPAAVGGPKSGQLAIGYFRTTNGKTDPNDTAGKWTYGTAETKNATAKHPKFRYADVRPGFTYHKGEICNAGILCGNVPGGPSDRSLLDFTSATVDKHGCPLFTFAGNPAGVSKGTNNYVTRQTSHCFAVPVSQNHPPAKHHHHHHHNGGSQGPSGPHPGSPAPRSSSGSLASTGFSPWLPAAGLVLLAAAALILRRIRRS